MWLEILPNTTILNDPLYFSPKYFSQLFSIIPTKFRLFIERDEEYCIRLLIEIDDNFALPFAEYASTLLKASVHKTKPPNLKYRYRLEATLANHFSYPISKSFSESLNQTNMYPLIPSDSLMTSILTLGTAVEIFASPSEKISREISSYLSKLKNINSKKIEMIYEKSLSRLFKCNIFIYGNTKEAIRATLASFSKTSMNYLIEYSIKECKKWKFKYSISNHYIQKYKSILIKYIPLSILILPILLKSNINSILELLLLKTIPNEIITCSIASLLSFIFLIITKEYKTIGLSDYELASIFSFPSPEIPLKRPLSIQKMVRIRNE
jgi:hypothetical protein